jgi:hypothetical protein
MEAAVVGLSTVVSHQKPVPGWNLDRDREIALWADAASADVGITLAYELA